MYNVKQFFPIVTKTTPGSHPTNPTLHESTIDKIGSYLVVTSTNNQNPVTVEPSRDIHFRKIFLADYVIQGIEQDGTSGNPKYSHLDLIFEEAPQFNLHNWIHANESKSANRIPLLLGQYPTSAVSYSPMRFVGECAVSEMNRFRIRLVNPDGTNATFSRYILIFYLQN